MMGCHGRSLRCAFAVDAASDRPPLKYRFKYRASDEDDDINLTGLQGDNYARGELATSGELRSRR